VLEELMRHCVAQGIIACPVGVDELFAPGTHDLKG
jgi:hypothetical protein